MKYVIAIIPLILVSGCYFSGNRGNDHPTDSATHPDTPADTTVDPDTTEPEVPDPACLYEPAGERPLSDDTHAVDAPHIYWTGTDVGVVSFEGGGDMWGHSYVSLTSVAADLSSHTERRMIGEESHGWGEPAWTGEALGLCWHFDPGYVSRTGFRLHDRHGDAIGPRVDLDFEGEACLDLEHGSGRFLAAWRHITWIDDDEYVVDTWLQRLDGEGNPLGEPVDIARAEYPGTTPNIEWDGESFLAVWCNAEGMHFMWVQPSGDSAVSILPVHDAAYCDFAMSEDGYAVAWTSGPRWERGLFMQIFDTELEAVSGRIQLEEVGVGASHPELEAAPDGWVVTWHVESTEVNHARLLHTDPVGIPRQPRISLHEGRNSQYGGPSIVQVDDDLFVGISHYPSEVPGLDQMYLEKYTCVDGEMDVCAEQDAEVTLLDICEFPIHFGWKWGGEACLELVGCSCVGEDCESLALSRWDCLSDRYHCG